MRQNRRKVSTAGDVATAGAPRLLGAVPGQHEGLGGRGLRWVPCPWFSTSSRGTSRSGSRGWHGRCSYARCTCARARADEEILSSVYLSSARTRKAPFAGKFGGSSAKFGGSGRAAGSGRSGGGTRERARRWGGSRARRALGGPGAGEPVGCPGSGSSRALGGLVGGRCLRRRHAAREPTSRAGQLPRPRSRPAVVDLPRVPSMPGEICSRARSHLRPRGLPTSRARARRRTWEARAAGSGRTGGPPYRG